MWHTGHRISNHLITLVGQSLPKSTEVILEPSEQSKYSIVTPVWWTQSPRGEFWVKKKWGVLEKNLFLLKLQFHFHSRCGGKSIAVLSESYCLDNVLISIYDYKYRCLTIMNHLGVKICWKVTIWMPHLFCLFRLGSLCSFTSPSHRQTSEPSAFHVWWRGSWRMQHVLTDLHSFCFIYCPIPVWLKQMNVNVRTSSVENTSADVVPTIAVGPMTTNHGPWLDE